MNLNLHRRAIPLMVPLKIHGRRRTMDERGVGGLMNLNDRFITDRFYRRRGGENRFGTGWSMREETYPGCARDLACNIDRMKLC
mmetsp:Transcript_45845/g.139253  ORF Transcript_45845/g.139253 Transcript_45845/m.139253 type:complete len:84 (+) Transcript_45845:139-390(+)